MYFSIILFFRTYTPPKFYKFWYFVSNIYLNFKLAPTIWFLVNLYNLRYLDYASELSTVYPPFASAQCVTSLSWSAHVFHWTRLFFGKEACSPGLPVFVTLCCFLCRATDDIFTVLQWRDNNWQIQWCALYKEYFDQWEYLS